MKINKDHLNLPFDQFSRQTKVYDIIESLRKDKQKFNILDVGGYKGITTKLHPEDEVIVLDLFDVKEKGYVKGSGLDLPFENETFDFVVSFDVLEHIENKDRTRFLEESSRVAKIAVITAAPVSSPANEKAEKSLNDLYKELHGEDHPWLKEHIEYGIPKPNQAKKIFESLGLKTAIYTSNDTILWELMQGTIFLNSKYPDDEDDLAKLNATYNHIAYNDGTSDPSESYRHITCGFKTSLSAETTELFFEKHNRQIGVEEKVEIVDRINQHYLIALKYHTDRYSEMKQSFLDKVSEKDFLERTIANITEERDSYKNELNKIKSSRSYRILNKAASAKIARKKSK